MFNVHHTSSSQKDDAPSFKLPYSNDELGIAYSMVAALYRLVLQLSKHGIYDEKADAIVQSAEKLLLRTDITRRILHIAGLERRQEFLAHQVEVLEQQKLELLDALQPFAQLQSSMQDDVETQHLRTEFTPGDVEKAWCIYNELTEELFEVD
ncbi:MAG: hypothetical protein R3E39_24020 [Anaerolineae bacterium]